MLNGQRVRFGGQVRSLPVPAAGKLVQLEVLLSGRWQTFRTARTDASGRWAIPYRFARTRGCSGTGSGRRCRPRAAIHSAPASKA